MNEHPISLVLSDDLRRSRLTVFFRLLLAIPHLVWLILWSITLVVAVPVTWLVTLVRGTPPSGLHRYLSSYVRYTTHLFAYLFLAANRYPPFQGSPGTYEVDLEIDPPARQSRWKTAFRLVLVLPALLLDATLAGGFGGGGGRSSDDWSASGSGGGLIYLVAFLAWFACLARGRMPRGFRNLVAFGLRYSAQTFGYLFLLTDRYPNADPELPAVAGQPPPHPIGLTADTDLRRLRLTVFFRLLLALPHFVWYLLWTVAALFAGSVGWLVALIRGRLPDSLHRFLSAYVRYGISLGAYVTLVANPFPGFTGERGYPVETEIAPPERQNRWVTGFRLLLGLPALLVAGGLGGVLAVGAILAWFAALVTGRMPASLLALGAFALRYSAQANGYLYLLTDRYPFSGPPAQEPEPEAEQALAAA